MNDELTKNVTGWLHSLLTSNRVQITSNEAEYVVQSKQWLEAVNTGVLLVAEAPSDPTPEE
jgi:hypothetical protein